jgi:hypothetical protein
MRGIPRLFRSEFHVLNTTGPGLVSRTLAENPELAKQVTILFPDDVCNETTWHHFGDLGVHIQEGSWRSKGSYIRRRLANLWEVWARRRLLRESLARGKSRSLPIAEDGGRMAEPKQTPNAQRSTPNVTGQKSAAYVETTARQGGRVRGEV